MEVLRVSTAKDIKDFLELPIRLYKGEKHWIRPLDQDVMEVFDPQKNHLLKDGECIQWLVKNDGLIVGRIAAFINRSIFETKNSKGQDLRVGGIGFFECIEDQNVANLLFETSEKWLKERGANAIDGPINFGDRDNWWGALAEGFDVDPNYKMPYTKKYYLKLFEDYGFQLYFKQLTYGRKVNAPLLPTYEKVAERLFANPDYRFATYEKNKLEKYAQDFCTIYNQAWGGHKGVKELSLEEAVFRMKQLQQVVDPHIVYFAYYKDEPIAFYINIPELNQVVKHIKNGKLDLMGKLKFLWHLKIAHTNKKMIGLVFGVVPEFQRKGAMIAIVEYCRRFVQDKIRNRYLDFEMNWIGDFNPKMMKVAEGIGQPIKVHHTYRKILDPAIEFERCPEI